MLGPRGSGKTTLLRELFSQENTLWIDFLREDEVLRFNHNFSELESRLSGLRSLPSWIVIDEIQRVPYLLDTVHRLIESEEFKKRGKSAPKFALTGSSARKLRRGAANLLAGRAFVNHLHPLTFGELGDSFELLDILQWGSLPKVFEFNNNIEKKEFLRSYVSTYLKEEIKEEQLVRKIEPFYRFLSVAAQSNGQILNYSKIARDCTGDSKAVERYFQLMDDTMIGFFLEPYHPSVRKRESSKPKFYLFDLGIKRALEFGLDVPLQPKTYAFGKAFEHFIILELTRLNHYFRRDFRFTYYRTKDDQEIDLIVERPGQTIALIEIKSTDNVDSLEIKRLSQLGGDFKNAELYVFCQETQARLVHGVQILPWREGIERIFEFAERE